MFAPDNGISHAYRPENIEKREAPSVPVVTEAGMFSLLLNLDDKTCNGADRIPNCFLRCYAEPVSKYMCTVYNKSVF